MPTSTRHQLPRLQARYDDSPSASNARSEHRFESVRCCAQPRTTSMSIDRTLAILPESIHSYVWLG